MKKNKGKKKKLTCYKCKQEGHYSNKFPEEEQEKTATSATSIKQVILMYTRRGFTIIHIHRDGQFEHIEFFLQIPTSTLILPDKTNMCPSWNDLSGH